jgi:Mn-dependent DtxR family transcriptional regulator
MTEHHDAEEYLDAIREGNHATSDIADAVGVARQSADERLRRLAEVGEVEYETVGNSLYWTVVNDE